MKRIKKLASVMLALIMVMAMALPAFAAEEAKHTITINENTADEGTHTYEAYQIFKGDKKSDQDMLSNIEWGSGVDGEALLNDLKTANDNDSTEIATFKRVYAETLAACKTATDVANFIATFETTTVGSSGDLDVLATIISKHLIADKKVESTKKIVEGVEKTVVEVVGDGYYLIKDKDGSLTDQKLPVVDKDGNPVLDEDGNQVMRPVDSAYTRLLLQVVGDPEVTVKSEVPSGEKKVYYYGQDALDQGYGAQDASTAGIGDHVSYEITSKVPNYTGYDKYYFVMNDTLSSGLTFDGVNSIKVVIDKKVNGKIVTEVLTPTEFNEDGTIKKQGAYCVYLNEDGYTFRLAFTNIKNYPIGSDIKVTYSATINKDAVVGIKGNPNTWTLNYSKNPSNSSGGEKEGKPGLPAEENPDVIGTSPEQKTLTYVTGLDITKYQNEILEDINKNLLAGAEFTLTGTSHQVVVEYKDYFVEDPKGTYYKLIDGTYTEEAPTGTVYKKIGVGTKDTTEGYLKDGETYYIPEDAKEYEGKTLYKLSKGTAEKYADVNTKYKKETVTGNNDGLKDPVGVDSKVSIELTTGSDGKISFNGLGEGTYTLTETVTPDGFNTIPPITFTIKCKLPGMVITGEETCEWTIEGFEGAEFDGSTGHFKNNIVNKSGSLLPSTGGIGTTIFYVVGGILVVAAGILLVVKKRMQSE